MDGDKSRQTKTGSFQNVDMENNGKNQLGG